MLFFSILQLVLKQIVQKIVRQIQGPANQILPWNIFLVIKYFQGAFMIFFTILQYMFKNLQNSLSPEIWSLMKFPATISLNCHPVDIRNSWNSGIISSSSSLKLG